MRSDSVDGHIANEWEGVDTDPGLLTPSLFTPGDLSDVFVLTSVEVILLIPLNIKNTLWAFEVLKILSLSIRLNVTTKFLALLGVEHLIASGTLLLGSCLQRAKRLEAHFCTGCFQIFSMLSRSYFEHTLYMEN